MTFDEVFTGKRRWAYQCGTIFEQIKLIPDNSIHCCVTSPPYFGLRNYQVEGQVGLEQTPDEYVAKIVEVFREVRRVLRNDGTLWLNLGDSYASAWACSRRNVIGNGSLEKGKREDRPNRLVGGLKEKDLIGIPWMVAFALRADGWYLRQDIIWSKPGPMPESVRDRCTKSHEYVFLFSKSKKYYFDSNAIAEKAKGQMGGKSFGKQKHESKGTGQQSRTYDRPIYETRNARSVWTISTRSYHGAHFAVMPKELARRCVKAGCCHDGIVFDPFLGSGTTMQVAIEEGRRCLGVELNPEYCKLIDRRMEFTTTNLFAGV